MKIELKKLIGTLDQNMKKYLEHAVERTIRRAGREVLIEDLLWVMLQEKKSVFNKLISHYEINPSEMIEVLESTVSAAPQTESRNPIFSSLLINWLEDAFFIAQLTLMSPKITEVALMYALFKEKERYETTNYFMLLENVQADVLDLLKGLSEEERDPIESTAPSFGGEDSERELSKYTTDLTELAKNGNIDPVLAREDEIKQAIDILSRRRKNNPILVGEAGVGKTAIVEGLALKIVNGDVPDHFKNVRLLSLDLGALQAGASIQGEFERRLQAVILGIKSSIQPTILFIDEAHTLIGAGGNEGGSDAANLLKPALARGELKTIAATTWLEYRKYFEKDPALARRFQKIDVDEPSIESCVTILRGIASKYEENHGVYIEDDALIAAAELSARYITGRLLPDKAIDVLDTACANVKISASGKPYDLQKKHNEISILKKELDALKRDDINGIKDNSKQISLLKNKIEKLEKEIDIEYETWKRQASKLEELKEARKTGDKNMISRVHKELCLLLEHRRYVYENVTQERIAEVISAWTGIPLGSMKRKRAIDVATIDKRLKENIIGQDESIEYLSTFLRISATGLKNTSSPEGVFLLVGPSGVGKTETAIQIAKNLFGGEKFLTTINMTEFQEKHAVSRLIGAPPGYVGYGEGGQLTDPVRIKPYSVVLLDEVEKAHPDILNIFYQIFDKGKVNDGEGRVIDFSNTIIIMTSNLGTEKITNIEKNKSIKEITQEIMPELRSFFKSALLGRINIVPYRNLNRSSLSQIVKLKLKNIENRLQKKSIAFSYENDLLDHIVTLSNVEETGARNLDLIINTHILPKISNKLLESIVEGKELKSLRVSYDDNKCDITVKVQWK